MLYAILSFLSIDSMQKQEQITTIFQNHRGEKLNAVGTCVPRVVRVILTTMR